MSPRISTESLVRKADDLLSETDESKEQQRILDLGTGSGCIVISLLAGKRNRHGVGLDLSTEALQVAKENAKELNVYDRMKFVQWDFGTLEEIEWHGLLSESRDNVFDVVVCNPPYLSTTLKGSLSLKALENDPDEALYATEKGYGAYVRLATSLGRTFQKYKNFCQYLIVEVKHKRSEKCLKIFMDEETLSTRISSTEILRDQCSLERAIAIQFTFL
jgi:release factor glutamine methyltransferase